MTTADEVLNQIDAAIADHTISTDAMRSQPSPPEPPSRGARMWIASADARPDESDWQEIGFVTDADFTIEGPAVDPELEQRWREGQEYMRRVEAERVRRAGESLAAAPAPAVAGELGKLAELHQQGVLSDQEFAAQKARLLGS